MWIVWTLGIIATYLGIGLCVLPSYIRQEFKGHENVLCHGKTCQKAASSGPYGMTDDEKLDRKLKAIAECSSEDSGIMVAFWPIGLFLYIPAAVASRAVGKIQSDAKQLIELRAEQAVRKAAEDKIIAELRAGNRDLGAFELALASAPLVQVAPKGKVR